MSRKTFTFYFVSLVSLGLAGFWLQIDNPSHSNARYAAGIALMFAAVVGMIVVFRRDLRTTDAERMAEWAEARPQGRRGFVLSQVRGSLPLMLLGPLAIVSGGYSPGHSLGETLRDFIHYLWLVPVGLVLVALWSLAWWHWQAKRYAADS